MGGSNIVAYIKTNQMHTIQPFLIIQKKDNTFQQTFGSGLLPTAGKKTMDEEADLTAEEVEEMEQNKAKEGYQHEEESDKKSIPQKGSSGPEEKDITD